jgi:hypothetical protein
VWEAIKQQYVDAPILIPPRWDLEFHVHTNASNLTFSDMLAQNPTRKCDQPIVYMFQLLNNAKKNYTTTERKALATVYTFSQIPPLLTRQQVFFNVNQ